MSTKSPKKERLIRNPLKSCVGVLLLALLALFIHYREIDVDIPPLGSRAAHYETARIDFTFPDKEEMEMLRRESGRDVGPVYRIRPEAIEKHSLAFTRFLMENGEWRRALPHVRFEEMCREADRVKEYLFAIRLTDVRTLQHLNSLQLFSPLYFPLLDPFDGQPISLSEICWQEIERGILMDRVGKNGKIDYILPFFRKLHWPLEKDGIAQGDLRKLIEDTFPKEYEEIREGTCLLHKGDTVTQKHVAMLRVMKKALIRARDLWKPLTLLGSFAFASLFWLLGAYYFWTSHRALFSESSKYFVYATIVVLTLVLAKATDFLVHYHLSDAGKYIDYPLFIPFAAVLLSILLNVEIALFTTCFMSVIFTLFFARDPNRFLILNLVSGIVAAFAAGSMRKRRELFLVYGKICLTCLPLFFAFAFSRDLLWDSQLLFDAKALLLSSFVSAVFVVGSLPLFESVFHIMTDITLMEYMDPDNALLRRLRFEAPGTYQHCLVVGSIAEAAAQSIGANGLFCHVSALYHDIGKLADSHYFTENQARGLNIHQLLTPRESAQVIISHISKGEMLAKKHSLPQNFIDVIREHHGTMLIYYFFCKAIEQEGGDVDAVEEGAFRYPGPKPQSRESAIIMMADAVEAASRSLEEVNERSLAELVERLIGDRLKDGQFSECTLTFREFEMLKKTMVHTLAVALHLRVKYPEK